MYEMNTVGQEGVAEPMIMWRVSFLLRCIQIKLEFETK
jgi:hypothetical protein